MLSPDSYLAAIGRDARLLADAARLGFEPPVPGCPGWDVGDLVEHTAIVHRHKIQILEEGWLEGSPDPVRPPGRRRLLYWFESGVDRLVRVLGDRKPAEPISTWDSSNETVGFWYRRMAQETFIHRIDAEQAHGLESDMDSALALDGIEELLASFIGGIPPWADVSPTESYVVLDPTDAEEAWNIRLAEFSGTSPTTGIRYREELSTMVEPMRALNGSSARVTGSAADIDLWLWGRAPLDQLAVEGEVGAARQLRTVAAASTS